MKNSIKFLFGALALSAGLAHARIAFDAASNYDDTFNPWNDGSNRGTGFQSWSLNSDNGGWIIQDADTNGASNLQPMNTGGESFAIFAEGFTNAFRSFNAPLNPGDTLSFQMGYQWDNGNKGFNLLSGGAEQFNFNINDSGYGWGGGGNAASTPWQDGAGDPVRENGVLINVAITATATGFEYAFNSPQDANLSQGGTISSGPIDELHFYVSGAGGDGGNLAFNNLEIIPEPSTLLLLVGGLGLLAAWKRRQG